MNINQNLMQVMMLQGHTLRMPSAYQLLADRAWLVESLTERMPTVPSVSRMHTGYNTSYIPTAYLLLAECAEWIRSACRLIPRGCRISASLIQPRYAIGSLGMRMNYVHSAGTPHALGIHLASSRYIPYTRHVRYAQGIFWAGSKTHSAY